MFTPSETYKELNRVRRDMVRMAASRYMEDFVKHLHHCYEMRNKDGLTFLPWLGAAQFYSVVDGGNSAKLEMYDTLQVASGLGINHREFGGRLSHLLNEQFGEENAGGIIVMAEAIEEGANIKDLLTFTYDPVLAWGD